MYSLSLSIISSYTYIYPILSYSAHYCLPISTSFLSASSITKYLSVSVLTLLYHTSTTFSIYSFSLTTNANFLFKCLYFASFCFDLVSVSIVDVCDVYFNWTISWLIISCCLISLCLSLIKSSHSR